MSVFKRGDIWHYDFTIDGERYRGSTRLRRKADAVAKVEQLKRAAGLGELGRAVPTLEAAANDWFAAKVAGRKSAKTVAQRLEIMLRHMDPTVLVTAIGAPDVQRAIMARGVDTTRQGRAPSNATINRDLIDTTLRPILRYCERILELPVRRIAWADLRREEARERAPSFSDADLAAWRAALPAWHGPVFDFIARYGVRLREAFFPPDAVDVAAGRVTLRDRKNGRDHTIPLLPEDRQDIAARVGRATAAGLRTVWFRERKDGTLTPIKWRGFQSASQTALERCQIAGARPVHDLRHHAATAALRRSGNLAAVKQLLGHDQIASTMRYAHVNDADVLAALGHTTPHSDSAPAKKPSKFKAVK